MAKQFNHGVILLILYFSSIRGYIMTSMIRPTSAGFVFGSIGGFTTRVNAGQVGILPLRFCIKTKYLV